MFKKFFAVSIIALFVVVGCKKASYDDAKAIMGKMIDVSESYVAAMEKATNGKEVADAMNKYTDEMAKLKPDMMNLQNKYPELKDQKEPPVELKDVIQKIGVVTRKMIEVSTKILPKYSTDPDVQNAQKRLTGIMR